MRSASSWGVISAVEVLSNEGATKDVLTRVAISVDCEIVSLLLGEFLRILSFVDDV